MKKNMLINVIGLFLIVVVFIGKIWFNYSIGIAGELSAIEKIIMLSVVGILSDGIVTMIGFIAGYSSDTKITKIIISNIIISFVFVVLINVFGVIPSIILIEICEIIF